MAKKRKQSRWLSVDDILATPDAPAGEREADLPLSDDQKLWLKRVASGVPMIQAARSAAEWVERFQGYRDELHDLLTRLYPGHRRGSGFLRYAAEVCRTTGLTIEQFNALPPDTELAVVAMAVEIREAEHNALIDKMRSLGNMPLADVTYEQVSPLLGGGFAADAFHVLWHAPGRAMRMQSFCEAMNIVTMRPGIANVQLQESERRQLERFAQRLAKATRGKIGLKWNPYAIMLLPVS